MNIVFLGLGTNLGDREGNLNNAVSEITKHIGKALKKSSVYETEPWGFQSDNEFLNIVVKVETELTPKAVLKEILKIEFSLGRVRGGNQYSSRIIDIDVLFYEDQAIESADLKVPHPKLHERKFVLVPLVEIEPELVHPVFKKSVFSLLEKCKDKAEVRKFRSSKPPF
jgi:2-amino-4-hydroxy-6-hydroxymethyldihydropteridine diphosphokinase